MPVSADRPNPPALPARTDRLQLEQSLEQLELNNQAHDDLFLLGCLSEQGSYVLCIANVPSGAGNANIQNLREQPGFVRFESGVSDSHAVCVDVFVHFSTAVEAAIAMASNPCISLDNGSLRRLQYDERDPEAVDRTAKRQKTEPSTPPSKCLVCYEELPGPHVRPCLFCDARWCYGCLKTGVSVALNDQERFPAKCCGRIIHFDVGRGIVPVTDHSKYKTRFEEHSTTKPVYCANSTCSKFLPPRLAKPDKRGRIQCFSCENVTCSKCRVIVPPADADTHTCTAADEMVALMDQFEYKRCPRCDAGIAKMFGCSHVRCQCGAHWCWDCQRAIQICWSKPCERAREDGEMTDDYEMQAEESDSDDETTPEGSTGELNAPMTAASVAATQGAEPGDAQSVDPEADAGEVEIQEPVVAGEQVGLDELSVPEDLSRAQNLPSPGQGEEPRISGTTETSNIGSTSIGGADQDESMNDPATLLVPPNAVPLEAASDAEGTPVPTPGRALIEYTPPAALTTTPLLPATQISSEVTEPPINLDAEDQDDWQDASFNFGDEPIDESWDTWGCLHHFNQLHTNRMHQLWLPTTIDPQTQQTVRYVDCLRCYKTITLNHPASEEKKAEAEAERKDSGVDVRPASAQQGTNVTATTTESEAKSKKKRKNRKDGGRPKLFNCAKCGVIYCVSCRKATMKELNVVLERNTIGS